MCQSNNSYLISLEGNWLNNYNYWAMSKVDVKQNITTDKVKVPNTYLKKTLIIIVLGFIMLIDGIITYYSVCKVIKERK